MNNHDAVNECRTSRNSIEVSANHIVPLIFNLRIQVPERETEQFDALNACPK
jgi:hypothetical protein